jgi:hypothetical protein
MRALRDWGAPPNERMKLTKREPKLGGRFRGWAFFTESRFAAYARCYPDLDRSYPPQ